MKENNGQETRHYQQAGVAMTCRSFEEYVSMFALQDIDRPDGMDILDVAGGASSFAATAARRGSKVTAVDPLYEMTLEQIAKYGAKEIEVSTAKLAELADKYRWDYYGNIDNHKANRERSLQTFLHDYGAPEPRVAYIAAQLPRLPLADDSFDLTLCSHFLFLYEAQFDYGFHAASVKELLRVTKPGGEVRLYPLVNFRTELYAHLDALRTEMETAGAESRLEASKLPFLPNSSDVLVFRKLAKGEQV
ncbi:class I SAM-dependent methyltransferase [Paenibacillus chartarius]|uniref:Class I SAM-dependent methyltransferase n=1 Tax=Paenibacillus chartarius TaxID=747481 RepID=A0ABV6DUM0_9BACL